MMARVLWICALGGLLVHSPLRAQDPRVEVRVPPEARASVQAAVEQARAEGLPTEPLVQKALEGASRSAEPTRISEAVRELAERLRTARSALGSRSTEAELVAGAGAIYVGVTAPELAQLRTSRPGESVALPLVALADLIDRGVARDTAVAVILSMVQARVPSGAYTTLRQSVSQDVRSGAPPTAAAHTRAQGVLMKSPRAPRSRPGPGPGRMPIGRRPF